MLTAGGKESVLTDLATAIRTQASRLADTPSHASGRNVSALIFRDLATALEKVNSSFSTMHTEHVASATALSDANLECKRLRTEIATLKGGMMLVRDQLKVRDQEVAAIKKDITPSKHQQTFPVGSLRRIWHDAPCLMFGR